LIDQGHAGIRVPTVWPSEGLCAREKKRIICPGSPAKADRPEERGEREGKKKLLFFLLFKHALDRALRRKGEFSSFSPNPGGGFFAIVPVEPNNRGGF